MGRGRPRSGADATVPDHFVRGDQEFARMARPTKFDAAKGRSAILLALGGEPQQWIARGVGVSHRTLQYWIARGRDGDPAFAEWAGEFDEAAERGRRRKFDLNCQRRIAKDKERWQAFKASREAWWLERLGPLEFWRRRLRWLAEKGYDDAYGRAIARLKGG
jgi:hypothetical protein